MAEEEAEEMAEEEAEEDPEVETEAEAEIEKEAHQEKKEMEDNDQRVHLKTFDFLLKLEDYRKRGQ